MADLVYKLHRDEGGWGIAPPDPFFQVAGAEKSASLWWEVADKTVIDKQTVCHTKGVMIRRSLSPIETEHDGELVIDTEELSGTLEETGLTDDISYYYKCFPYSDHAVYNRGKDNLREVIPGKVTTVIIQYYNFQNLTDCKIEAKKGNITYTATLGSYNGNPAFILKLPESGKWRIGGQLINVKSPGQTQYLYGCIYGYDWDLLDTDPESNISYPNEVYNRNIGTPLACTSTAADLSMSGWGTFVDWLGIRPVILSYDGVVIQELDSDDQSKNTNNQASYYNSTGEYVNTMVEFPKRYFKRWTDEDGHYAHFRVSEYKLGDDWKCYPWMYGDDEETAHENDNIYIAMTHGIVINNQMRSIYQTTVPKTGTVADLQAYIKPLGTGWMLNDYSNVAMITDYMIMMSKSTNVVPKLGFPYYNSSSAGNETASYSVSGFYGKNATGTFMRFMWLTDWYGRIFSTTLGMYYYYSTNELFVKDYPPYICNSDAAAEDYIGYYQSLGRGIDSTGYISKVTYDEHGMIPQAGGGSTTTYVPYSLAIGKANTQVLYMGGTYTANNYYASGFRTNFVTNTTSTGGCRLTYKSPTPPAE